MKGLRPSWRTRSLVRIPTRKAMWLIILRTENDRQLALLSIRDVRVQ